MATRLPFIGALSAAALSLTVVAAPVTPAGAAPQAGPDVPAAVDWLVDQQQADGGFELSGFPGFETPDAVLALAAAAQDGPGWDRDDALAAVEATTTDGHDPLDAVDAWVDSVQGDPMATASAKAQQASKVMVLVTEPLGLDPNDFDPAADSEDPVDLEAAMLAAADGGAYGALPFTGRLYVAWALAARDLPVPAALVAAIEAAQKPNGSFDYTGLPTPADVDPDTTAVAIIALLLAGEPADGPVLSAARAGLGLAQLPTGNWATAFDDGNPNSTSAVVIGAATMGVAGDDPAWRDTADERLTGVPYPSPVRAISRWQAADGHIASPNDAFGLNTFATSQGIQAVAAAQGAWPYEVDPGFTEPSASANRRLVNALYVDLLGRPADAAGATFWEGQLDAGRTPAEVARSLTRTTEYATRVVVDASLRYRGAVPSAEELSVFVPAVLAGDRDEVFAAMFAETMEDPEDWAADLFLTVLGRPGSEADIDWALGLLDGGALHLDDVALIVLRSPEARGVWVSDTYLDLLRRSPNRADRTFWVGQLGAGRNPSHLVAQIAGSAEYRRQTAAPATS